MRVKGRKHVGEVKHVSDYNCSICEWQPRGERSRLTRRRTPNTRHAALVFPQLPARLSTKSWPDRDKRTARSGDTVQNFSRRRDNKSGVDAGAAGRNFQPIRGEANQRPDQSANETVSATLGAVFAGEERKHYNKTTTIKIIIMIIHVQLRTNFYYYYNY